MQLLPQALSLFHVGFVQRRMDEGLMILWHGKTIIRSKRPVVCCTQVEWLGKSSEATFQFGFVLYRPKSRHLGSRLQTAGTWARGYKELRRIVIMDSYRLKIQQ